MPTSPKISVLLPTHNRADVLGVAIASVLKQSFGDFELIVVGDGCGQDTADVVKAIDDPRIIWLDLPKALGHGYASRNVGLSKARGELVVYAQHDDLMLPSHLARLDHLFTSSPEVDWAHTRASWVNDKGFVLPYFLNLSHSGMQKNYLHGRFGIPSSCVAHRARLIDEVGGFDETLETRGDFELWTRMISASPAAIRCIRANTVLHFRANWRHSANWVPLRFAYLDALTGSSNWPRALRLDTPPDGEAIQHVVWDQISSLGARLERRIQWGTDQLQDVLLTSFLQHPLD